MNKTKFFSSLLVGLLVTTGLFTSCKDYDDDIKNLQAQIDQKSLKTDLESLKSSLEAKLATLESTLNTKEAALKAEIAKKANQTDLDALTTVVNGKANQSALDAEIAARVKAIEDLTAEIAGIKTKIATIEATLGTKADQSALDALKLVVDDKADKSALQAAYDELLAKIAENAQGDQADEQALQNAIATLTGKIDERLTEAQVKAIVDESAAAQTVALQALKSEIEGKLESLGLTKADIEKLTDVNNKIAAIEDALKAFTGATTIEEAKEKMQELAEKVNENVAAINILEAFVKKQLTSMVLMPSFYWEGLEAIEVPFASALTYGIDDTDYKFTYTVNNALGTTTVKVKVADQMAFNAKDNNGKASLIPTEHSVSGDETYGIWDKNGTLGGGRVGKKNIDDTDAYYLRGKLGNKAKLDSVELSKGGIAKYHYNPSTADLTGYEFSFFENDAEVYTRADGNIVAKPRTDGIKAENGTLTVPFDVNGGKLLSMFKAWAASKGTITDAQGNGVGMAANGNVFGYYPTNDNKGTSFPLPFIAAQMAKGDTIVTSDYGVVVPAEVEIIALADNAPLKMIDGKETKFVFDGNNVKDNNEIRANHLYESVGYDGIVIPNTGVGDNYGAITMPATHEIVYNAKVFDLTKFIETHARYTTYTKYGRNAADTKLTAEELEAMGLHYEYQLIDYWVGEETTSQTAHLVRVNKDGSATSSDEKDGYFSVRSVDAEGNTMVNEEATLETVGREPLIRVLLKTEKGEIVRYGYVKLRIAKDAAQNMDVAINLGEMWMNCGEEKKVTWAQMENIILRQINMTKQDFEKAYYLDVVGGFNYMPHINVTGLTPAETAGPLYTSQWQARRFYLKDASKKEYDEVPGLTYDTFGDGDYAKLTKATKDGGYGWNNAINKFGRVWYTPHDNQTTTQNWDQNTNVLVWNLKDMVNSKNTATGAGTEYGSNMTAKAYEQMISILGATYNNKGVNKDEFSTVVRFVNKNNGTYIYVKLYFEPEKVHFAYGDINNRVLDHWYDFKNGYAENTADSIEVYANVPTPALNNNAPLTVNSFTKDLKEYWLNQEIIPTIYNKDKFSKFAENDITFQFRLPKKGETTTGDKVDGMYVNSSTTDFKSGKIKTYPGGTETEVDGLYYWEVKGASGATYKLYLASGDGLTTVSAANVKAKATSGNKIVAVKQGKMNQDEIVATITPQGVIKYNGYSTTTMHTPENVVAATTSTPAGASFVASSATTLTPTANVNSAATDILNYMGMYDATGKLIKDDYLDGQTGAFAAYVEINVANEACYNPLMGKNFFNVRFLRPVNMWPAKTEWTDAPNDTQIYPLWKLVYIRDWRQFPVVMLGAEQQFGEAAKPGTGEDGETYTGAITGGVNGVVTYQYYNIANLYVNREEIRSDAYLNADNRTILTDPAKIAALKKVGEIPALTGTNSATAEKWEFLKIWRGGNPNNLPGYEDIEPWADRYDAYLASQAQAAGAAATGLQESGRPYDLLAYTNNSGVVKEFHIYVPVSLKYPWGSVTDWTQKVWAVITVKPTTGNE